MSDPSPTRISKLLDWLYATLPTILTDHQELLDPDDLFENTPSQLERGWGISLGDGQNTNRDLCSTHYHWAREFTVVITHDLRSLGTDLTSRRSKQKAALEWTHKLLQLFGRTSSIVDPLDSTRTLSFKADVLRDSGPRQITINDTPYLFVEITISLEYRELTT